MFIYKRLLLVVEKILVEISIYYLLAIGWVNYQADQV